MSDALSFSWISPSSVGQDRCVSFLRCEEDSCKGLLRPHVVWFGETLDPDILTQVEKELEICDLCLVVRTTDC